MFPTTLDNSARLEWAACPTKFYWSNIRKLRPMGKNIHLRFGGALADGLDAFRKSYYRDGKDWETCLRDGWAAAIEHWGDESEEGQGNKTLSNLLITLEDYVHHFSDDSIRPMLLDGEPCTEFSFAVPIPETSHPETGEPILFTGRFDVLAEYHRDPSNKTYWVLDDKTTGSLGQSWLDQWSLSSQMIGYCWASRQYGIPVEGAIIRGTCPLSKEIKFAQTFRFYPDFLINRWLEQLKRDVNQMIEAYKDNFYDMNFGSACTDYGGCKFLPICTSRDREMVAEMDYEHDDWNPLG